MNKEALAAQLNGREYGEEITEEEEKQAEGAGLLVVFGYSDDTVEFRGSVRLWVKETHAPHPQHPLARCAYQADMKSYGLDNGRANASEDSLGTVLGAPVTNPSKPWGGNWKPSIFMRRCYSRITLEITGVRVERLNEISKEDCYAEGIDRPQAPNFGSAVVLRDNAVNAYKSLWESINGPGSWAKNPWVWCISFRKL